MPGQRYQNPEIETRKDVKRPYYYIRPYVPIITPEGILRKQKPVFLGFVRDTTKRQAEIEKQRQMLTINDGKFLIQSQIPFQAVLDRYVEIRLPQIPATEASYRNKIEKHIRPAFAWTSDGRRKRLLRMCEIDKPTVEAWLNAKAAEGYSHNTLLDLRKVLSAIFSQAKEWKMWSGENPCWDLKDKIGGVTEVFTKKLPAPDGLSRFLGAIKDTAIISAEGARLLVITCLASGTRVCEVLGLQLEDIDAIKETLKIERDWARGRIGPTKTPESRRVRQIPGLAGELIAYASKQRKRSGDFLFGRANDGGNPPDDRDLQQHVFRPAAEQAGIYTPGFGLRRFRHINITWRQEEGAHPLEAMKQAGHTRLSTTFMYTQTDEERERVHVTKIMERVHGKPAGAAVQ